MPRPTLQIRRVTHMRPVWRGIRLKITYHYQYTKAYRWQEARDHIAVHVIGPDADLCPLPTGYQSLFVATRQLRRAGGPLAYVIRHLDASAADPRWIKTERQRRQLDLFQTTPAARAAR